VSVRVNLGCGRDIREGYINIDTIPHPGVVVANIDAGLPFHDESIDYVYASHVLEHVHDLSQAMHEVYRILRVGGILSVRVPYGLKGLYNPFHLRAFDKQTLSHFTRNDGGFQARLLFVIEQMHIARVHVTFNPWFFWHFRQYLPRLYSLTIKNGYGIGLPIGNRELRVRMRKVVT
jgi:ubiquinone/menaquinone biosynthesis C-methylase UbiE